MVGLMLLCVCVQYIDLVPDPQRASCMSAFNRSLTANYVERTPTWHHLAVTWTKEDGLTKIYKDGLIMAEVRTSRACLQRA